VGIKYKKRSSALPVTLILAGILVLWLVFSGRPPSDARLAAQFHGNLPAFVELRSMLATNPPADPAGGATSVWSQEHYRRYQALLRQTRVIRVLQDASDLRFQLVGALASGKGGRIAVTWTTAKPDRLIPYLDDFRKAPGRPDHAYRSLGDGWYLWIAK
jgi:hypothetical protein